MKEIPYFPQPALQALCNLFGDTYGGLTGSEIGDIFVELGIRDSPISTKRSRLFDALSNQQTANHSGAIVALFIQNVMNPVRYINNKTGFEERRDALNQILSFSGIYVDEDGQVRVGKKATTLDEAEKRATRLRQELLRRGVHSDVLKFCRAELLQKNYFHAVFEATKSIAEKIRQITGLTSDGNQLVDEAFGLGNAGIPRLAFNTLRTETEQSEHKGLANLIRGVFGTFRNVTAHAPKIMWNIEELDALDLLTVASLIHRKLDKAVNTQRIP